MEETPRYSDINDAELKEIEAEFGRPLTRDLALWFIRNRTSREAIERMLKATDANQTDVPHGTVRGKAWSKSRPPIPTLKAKKKCA
jgi:hypothetical protein